MLVNFTLSPCFERTGTSVLCRTGHTIDARGERARGDVASCGACLGCYVYSGGSFASVAPSDFGAPSDFNVCKHCSARA